MEGAVGEVGGKINSQKNPQIRKDAIEKYREEITKVLIKFLQQIIVKFSRRKGALCLCF